MQAYVSVEPGALALLSWKIKVGDEGEIRERFVVSRRWGGTWAWKLHLKDGEAGRKEEIGRRILLLPVYFQRWTRRIGHRKSYDGRARRPRLCVLMAVAFLVVQL